MCHALPIHTCTCFCPRMSNTKNSKNLGIPTQAFHICAFSNRPIPLFPFKSVENGSFDSGIIMPFRELCYLSPPVCSCETLLDNSSLCASSCIKAFSWLFKTRTSLPRGPDVSPRFAAAVTKAVSEHNLFFAINQ